MLLIIGILIGIGITIINLVNGGDWLFDGWFEKIVGWILNIILGAIIGFIIGLLISLALPMQLYDKHYSFQLEALQDGNSLHGSFFLGCGTIDNKMQYVWYHGENGIYEMKQVKAELVKIKYTDGQARVNVTEISATDSWINWFAIDMDLHSKMYLIEVPRGTIKQNYTLDAQ